MRSIILGCVLFLFWSCTKEKLEKPYEKTYLKPMSWCAYENFQWKSYSFELPLNATIKNTGTNIHRYFYRINKYDEFYNEYSEEGVLASNETILPQTLGRFAHNIINPNLFRGYGIQVFPEFNGECTGISYLDIVDFTITKTDKFWFIDLMVENGEKLPFNGKIKLHFTQNGKVVSIHTLNTTKNGLPSNAVLPVRYIVESHLLKGADDLSVVFADLGFTRISKILAIGH